MKNALRTIVSVIAALAMALALAGCVPHGTTSSSSAAAQSSPAASSSSAASASSATGATSSASSTPSTASQYESGVYVSEDDPSYAENHLSGGSYQAPNITVERNGTYTDKDHVALYIHTYGTVPSNYVSKTKARNAGWVNTKGNLWDVLPGKSIGGGGFYNDDGTMPDAAGREWYECDIDYDGGFRNSKRIVYSSDGLIYYTDDHYKTFQRLY